MAADLETIHDKQENNMRVWASGLLELGHNGNNNESFTPILFETVEETIKHLARLKENVLLYYHNLQYDGTFWLHALNGLGYTQHVKHIKKSALKAIADFADRHKNDVQAIRTFEDSMTIHGAVDVEQLQRGEYTYRVDDMGKWFSVTVRLKNGYVIELRDSLKLFPMSIASIGAQTKYKLEKRYFEVDGELLLNPSNDDLLLKGSMDYNKAHAIGAPIEKDDAIYLCKDLAILGKTLEDFILEFNNNEIQGMPLTIGQSAFSQFKRIICEQADSSISWRDDNEIMNGFFPDLSKVAIKDDEKFIVDNTFKQDISVLREIGVLDKYGKDRFGDTDNEFLYYQDARAEKCSSEDLQKMGRLVPITQDQYIRAAYKGGWCYTNPKFKGMILTTQKGPEATSSELVGLNAISTYYKGGRLIKVGHMACSMGCTLDVNSLYPFVMSSASNNKYAHGVGRFYNGDVPQWVKDNPEKYCVYYRVLCDFDLKENHFPTVQIKNNILCNQTEWLTTSKFRKLDGTLWSQYEWRKETHDTRKMLTFYETDFELFKESYNLSNFEIVDCLVFEAFDRSFFDSYIGKFAKMKIKASQEKNGFKRMMAKLFLNNLYGKMATSTASNTKTYEFTKDGSLKAHTWFANNKKAGYVAIGAAITANARCYTIRAANENYEYFAYADTDSIHCICPPEMLKGVNVDADDSGIFGLWKCENTWTQARFLGPKTYFEQDGQNDPIIKACGAPSACKQTFTLNYGKYANMSDEELYTLDVFKDLPPECQEQIKEKRLNNEPFEIADFDIGLCLAGKLIRKQLQGGCLLKASTFEIRDRGHRNVLKEMGFTCEFENTNKKDLCSNQNQTQGPIHQPKLL